MFIVATICQLLPSDTLPTQYSPAFFLVALACHVTGMRALGKAPLILEGMWLATGLFSIICVLFPFIAPLIIGE